MYRRFSAGRYGTLSAFVLMFGIVTAMPVTILKATAAEKEAAAGGAEDARLILDTRSWWRAFVMLRPTLFGTRNEAKEERRGRLAGRGWSHRKEVLPPGHPHTPAPPRDWMMPDFDDAGWRIAFSRLEGDALGDDAADLGVIEEVNVLLAVSEGPRRD